MLLRKLNIQDLVMVTITKWVEWNITQRTLKGSVAISIIWPSSNTYLQGLQNLGTTPIQLRSLIFIRP